MGADSVDVLRGMDFDEHYIAQLVRDGWSLPSNGYLRPCIASMFSRGKAPSPVLGQLAIPLSAIRS
ncbi:MAG: hypothetical protein CM15mP120_02720 [Pseudomonadota bacterium]|nr:MAG: hypothetical protein CM15mP120_02720 [Pseudomonadota bacterium]